MIEFKSFKTPEEVSSWVASRYSSVELDSVNTHKQSDSVLSFYKGGSYRTINEYLRAGAQSHPDLDIKELQDLLCRQALPDSIVTYRFVSLREFLLLLWKTRFGRVYIYPSFLSTTLLDEEYSMDDIKLGRIPINIHAPYGSKGIYLPEVNPNSPEFEILFAHHTKIRRESLFKYSIVSD